jgi:hypothetical protein
MYKVSGQKATILEAYVCVFKKKENQTPEHYNNQELKKKTL